MEDWMLAAGGASIPLFGLMWRLVSALVKLQIAVTKIADDWTATMEKHTDHIEEEKRHHTAVEGLLQTIAGVGVTVPITVEPSPSGRIPTGRQEATQ